MIQEQRTVQAGRGADIRLIARSSTLKRINMRRFLMELRRRGPSTRAELTRAVGVAPPTSSTIIGELLDAGWIEESSSRSAVRGRPGKVFRLSSTSSFVLGLELGPEECTLAPAGLDARLDPECARRFATPNDYSLLLDEIARQVAAVHAERCGSCLGVGVSVPGLIDERAGVVAFSPNLHTTDGRRLAADISERIGVDAVCVQEEHALCLAEQSFGEAQELSNFVTLDISFGMGMGVVSGGRYISGSHGFAGEIGHLIVKPDGDHCGCGNRGCMETVATDVALLRAVRRRLGSRLSFEEMEALAREGTIDIGPELAEVLDYLGTALAGIVNIFNPSAVYVSGRMLRLDPNAMRKLNAAARERILRPSRDVQILPGRASKLSGALVGLLDQLFASVGPLLE